MNADSMKLLTLKSDHWYLWQMLPGYSDVAYNSPIKIHEVTALKTGKGILRIHFYNAFYAEGVRSFVLDLRVLKRTDDYIVAELIYGDGPNDRVGIIQEVTFPRIRSIFGSDFPKPKGNEDEQMFIERITSDQD